MHNPIDLRETVLRKYVINLKSHVQACMMQTSVFIRKAHLGQMAPKKLKKANSTLLLHK